MTPDPSRLRLIAGVALFALIGCNSPTEFESCVPGFDCEIPEGGAMVLNEVGRVSLVQDGVVLFIVDRGEYDTAYQVYPELPFIYRKDGLRIRFDGFIYPIPPNVRMMGAPLRWTSVQKE